MFLAVVPLQEIATARSDRIRYWLRNIFWSYGNIIIVMIMISTFACNNGLIMAGASVLYNGSRRSFQEKRLS
jgi:APA family basic amino acid/polyamine antiporter